MKIAIFGNAQKGPALLEEVRHVLNFLLKKKVEVVLSKELRRELNLMQYDFFEREKTDVGTIDFALSVGGDGTFLTTAAEIGDTNIPILGINYGHLGFLADVDVKEVDSTLRHLIHSEYTIEQRSMLHVSGTEGLQILAPNALNEIAISKQGLSSMISIETRVNGELLHTYAADGLVVATPTGSTAYNMSIGGPLMIPQSRGILLSPVASHSLNVKPLVVPDDWKIDIKVRSRNGNYMFSVDGRSQIVSDQTVLHIEKGPYTVKLVQVGKHSFIQTLKEKLLWGAN